MGIIMGARELRATTVTPARRGAPRCRYLSLVAVAPTYEIAPTMPHVYKAARERIAGLKKNRGLRVAAWQALNASQKKVLLHGFVGRGV